MAKVKLDKTIYQGFEGSNIEVKIFATELNANTTPSLSGCSLKVVPSTFFNDSTINVSEDVEGIDIIKWGEVVEGKCTGTSKINLKKDNITEENGEGGLILLESKNTKKIRPVKPSYGILLIHEPPRESKSKGYQQDKDAHNDFRFNFEKAKTQLMFPPQNRTHFMFSDFVIHIKKERFISRVLWQRFLASEVDVWYIDGKRSVCGYFSDLFIDNETIYAITVYKPYVKADALYIEFCRKVGLKPDNTTKIEWEHVTEEELFCAAESSGYKNWGEFGNVFGGEANTLRELPAKETTIRNQIQI